MQDFSEYCEIEEGLTYKVAKDYKNTIKRLLKNAQGVVSRRAIREYLKFYLENRTAKTYNNNLDGVRAFVERYLGRPELTAGFKHRHVPDNYEEELPTEAELRKGFESLDTDQERAIYLFYATTGLRRTEVLDLSKGDIDRGTKCVKSKHDTRTKKAGVTFYNDECEQYLNRIWNSHRNRLFNFKVREFKAVWRKASENAGVEIRPQILRKWQATMLGELGVPDRYVDIFQGRAPRGVLARHYTGKGLERLKRIYDQTSLKVLA